MLYVLSWLIGTKDGSAFIGTKMLYVLSWLSGTKDGMLSSANENALCWLSLCAFLANWHVNGWHALCWHERWHALYQAEHFFKMLYVLSWLIGTKDGMLSYQAEHFFKMLYVLSWLIGTKDGMLSLPGRTFL